MAYNRTQVHALLNATERDLFEASLAAYVKALTATQLRGKINRTRALRDKYRDLLRRQKLATRGRTGNKMGVSGAANQRTEQKAVVLAEVLQRYEKRALQLDAAQARAAEKTAAAAARLELQKERSAARTRPAAKAPAKKAATVKPPAASLKQASGQLASAPTQGKRTRAKVTAADPRGLGPTSESARAMRPAKQQEQSGSQRIQGHVGTQVRRGQAKRDSRGS